MSVSRCMVEVQREHHCPSVPVSTVNYLLGMGDQIKRYCEKLEREEYDEVVSAPAFDIRVR